MPQKAEYKMLAGNETQVNSELALVHENSETDFTVPATMGANHIHIYVIVERPLGG